jgi:rhamnulokinase
MNSAQFIALDFGASSGRVILATLGKTIRLEEMHRFPNQQIKIGPHYYWDVLKLFSEAKQGLKIVSEKSTNPISGLGVDTWGVDFGLIDPNGMLLSNPITYRDPRTDGMMEKTFEKMSRKDIYRLTGIQFLQFNTIFQLMSLVESNSSVLEAADQLLFIPDLMNYFLTGQKGVEYTIASTSQLLNAETRQWESTVFQKLGIPQQIMPLIQEPGTIRGQLLPDIADETGLGSLDVIATSAHDTASAVAAVPAQEQNWAYLSSGTWSVIGVELDQPIINETSAQNNFTNEGGVGRKIRFLQNVMGMWLLESCVKVWERNREKYRYDELLRLAEKAPSFHSIINPDDPSFLNPMNMVEVIQDYCRSHHQQIPETEGEIVRTILESLAFRYRWVLDKIEEMQGRKIKVLHIVGGGSQNQLLNQFTANATGRSVIAGPVEATALGNVIMQAISKGYISSIQEGRQLIRDSFPIKQFEPQNQDAWNTRYHKIQSILN